MAAFGAKRPVFAPIVTEPDDALPTYGTGAVLGKLAAANLTINLATGELPADDEIAEQLSEFASATLALETDDILESVHGLIFGATVNGNNVKDYKGDTPPLGGLGYYKSLMRNGVRYFKAYYYPKARAALGNDNATTRGTSGITFQTTPTTFTIFAPNYGQWREMELFTDESQAILWVDAKLGRTAAFAVEVQVNGAGASEAATPIGLTMVKSGENFVLTITGTPTALYDNGVDNVAAIADGVYTIAAVAAAHKVAVIF